MTAQQTLDSKICFPVSPVAKATNPLTTRNAREALATHLGGPVESCSDFSGDVVPVEFHPLFAAVHLAFNDHRPLILSPDMIWLAIVQGVAIHVNNNSLALREHFVRHEGKLEIVVRRDDFVRGLPQNPWPEVFAEFSERIKIHIGTKHAIFVESFSTTGPIEKAAFEISLMDAMQKYFNFLVISRCGIPEITLEGRESDWQKISDSLQEIEKLGLDTWVKYLKPILAQFIRACRGDVDGDFWRSIYKTNDQSGGPYVNGWLTHLIPYSRGSGTKEFLENPWMSGSNEWPGGISTSSLPSGISKAPFQWNYHETIFDYELLGGFLGVDQDSSTLALRPKIGWAVRPARSQ
jgi:hypothetical protein